MPTKPRKRIRKPKKKELDPKKLKAMTNTIIATISHPSFIKAMKEMKATPQSKRLRLAEKILTKRALIRSGIKLPRGMRVTSRYFEPGSPKIIEVIGSVAKLHANKTDLLVPIGPMGAWACACGGAATVCGGAGGGT